MPFLFQDIFLRGRIFPTYCSRVFLDLKLRIKKCWEMTSEKLFKVGPDLPEFIRNRVESEENMERHFQPKYIFLYQTKKRLHFSCFCNSFISFNNLVLKLKEYLNLLCLKIERSNKQLRAR